MRSMTRHNITILEGLEDAGFTVTTRGLAGGLYGRVPKGRGGLRGRVPQKSAETGRGEYYGTSPISILSEDRLPGRMWTNRRRIPGIWVIARQAGEGADRKLKEQEYSLSDEERNNLIFCAEHYEKLILVINGGFRV